MKTISFFAILILSFFTKDVFSQEKVEISCFQIISGTVKDVETNASINNVLIKVYSANTLIDTILTGSKGTFNFKVSCDNSYSLVASKTQYSETKKKFVTSNASNIKVEFTIYIKKLKTDCFHIFNGRITDETENPIEKVTIKIRNKNMHVIATDISNSNGNYHFNLPCKKQLTALFLKNGYVDATTNLKTPKNSKKIYRKDIILRSKPVLTTTSKTIEIDSLKIKKSSQQPVKIPIKKEVPIKNIKSFKFELNSSKITPNIAIELNKVFNLMTLKPTVKVELNSYTDSRGPSQYNLNLTQARAQAMISYLISKGIDSSRISGKGYGDTKLLNDCTKEKHCSDKEHRKNKRIEIIIHNNESI